MKRTTFILTLLLSAATMMAEEFTIGLFTYQTTSVNEVEIINADQSITSAHINSTITYQGVSYTVTSIGDYAFAWCESLTSITIPNSVTSIGDVAFYRCYSLMSITIPNSVKSIGDCALSDCTSLTSITIPNSVTSIGSAAFEGTAFYNNPSNWDKGALYLGDCLIRLADGYVGDYKIKESTRLIADDAFAYCSSLTSITIPNSVTSIGYRAFASCEGLTSITIPNSVTSIGYWAFGGCTGLTSITIPNSVTSIGDRAFEYCSSLNSVTVPSHTEIGTDAFPSYTQIIRK